MLRLTGTACIEASKERVWEVLADVANIDLWVDPIETAECEGEQSRGVGTRRVCHLKGGIVVKEQWTQWDEGTSFTYQGYGAPLMKRAQSRWSVKSVDGKTLLSTEATVELMGGVFGRLLEPLVRLMSNRLGSNSLAGFKYLAETGHPYAGMQSDLPRVPTIC